MFFHPVYFGVSLDLKVILRIFTCDLSGTLPFPLPSRKSITAQFDERQYLFLKRLCQVLVALGEVQLFHLWVRGEKINFVETVYFFVISLFK